MTDAGNIRKQNKAKRAMAKAKEEAYAQLSKKLSK